VRLPCLQAVSGVVQCAGSHDQIAESSTAAQELEISAAEVAGFRFASHSCISPVDRFEQDSDIDPCIFRPVAKATLQQSGMAETGREESLQ
jgi:hypothetical protein